MRLEELLRDDLVDDERERGAAGVLQVCRRTLVGQHHVEPRHAEHVAPVDEVHRTLLDEVHHVVHAQLRHVLVRHDHRNGVCEVEANSVVGPERQLQGVSRRVERGVRRGERPLDDMPMGRAWQWTRPKP